jgi:hypothetical protein
MFVVDFLKVLVHDSGYFQPRLLLGLIIGSKEDENEQKMVNVQLV